MAPPPTSAARPGSRRLQVATPAAAAPASRTSAATRPVPLAEREACRTPSLELPALATPTATLVARSGRRELRPQRFVDSVDHDLDDPSGLGLRVLVGDLHPQVERAGPEVIRQSADGADVREPGQRRGVQEHRTCHAAVPPLVLVLDEGRVRPLDDAQVQGVRAGPDHSVTSNSAARCESLLRPTCAPFTRTTRTLSAAPTWSTTRRPAQAGGSSKVRS